MAVRRGLCKLLNVTKSSANSYAVFLVDQEAMEFIQVTYPDFNSLLLTLLSYTHDHFILSHNGAFRTNLQRLYCDCRH